MALPSDPTRRAFMRALAAEGLLIGGLCGCFASAATVLALRALIHPTPAWTPVALALIPLGSLAQARFSPFAARPPAAHAPRLPRTQPMPAGCCSSRGSLEPMRGNAPLLSPPRFRSGSADTFSNPSLPLSRSSSRLSCQQAGSRRLLPPRLAHSQTSQPTSETKSRTSAKKRRLSPRQSKNSPRSLGA